MAPSPSFGHQQRNGALYRFFEPLLRPRGLGVVFELNLMRPDVELEDFRIPDQTFYRLDRPDLVREQGLVGAEAVVEIRSPDDETYEKLDFYAELGVREVIVLDRDSSRVEIFRLAGARYVAVSPDDRGRLYSEVLDARFAASSVNRRLLRVECGGAAIEV